MNNTSNFHYRFIKWSYEWGPDPDQTQIDYKCYGMNTPLAREMQFRWYQNGKGPGWSYTVCGPLLVINLYLSVILTIGRSGCIFSLLVNSIVVRAWFHALTVLFV